MEVINKILKSEKQIEHNIVLLNILLACKKDEELSKEMQYVINKNNEMQQEIQDYLQKLAAGESSPTMRSLYNQIVNDCDTILNIIDDAKAEMFSKFKAASLLMLDNMSNENLVVFEENLNLRLQSFTNWQELSEHIYEDTVTEVVCFTKDLLQYINDNATMREKRIIPLAYLQKILSLKAFTFKDWVEIYNNLKFTIKYLAWPNPKEYLEIKERFDQIELYYFIVITIN